MQLALGRRLKLYIELGPRLRIALDIQARQCEAYQRRGTLYVAIRTSVEDQTWRLYGTVL